jgi:hypothetical protein
MMMPLNLTGILDQSDTEVPDGRYETCRSCLVTKFSKQSDIESKTPSQKSARTGIIAAKRGIQIMKRLFGPLVQFNHALHQEVHRKAGVPSRPLLSQANVVQEDLRLKTFGGWHNLVASLDMIHASQSQNNLGMISSDFDAVAGSHNAAVLAYERRGGTGDRSLSRGTPSTREGLDFHDGPFCFEDGNVYS